MNLDFDDITDPDLMLPAAAHEAGHAVAALAAGFPVRELRLWRHGKDRVSGYAHIDHGDDLEGEELDCALITAVSGHEAQALWLTEYAGYRFLGFRDRSTALSDSQSDCCGDLEMFRRMRRDHSEALTQPAARIRARALLASRWRSVEQLAVRLARHQRLTAPTA